MRTTERIHEFLVTTSISSRMNQEMETGSALDKARSVKKIASEEKFDGCRLDVFSYKKSIIIYREFIN